MKITFKTPEEDEDDILHADSNDYRDRYDNTDD